MAKLAREDELFIVDEEVDRGCSCTVFTRQKCTHVAKLVFVDVPWKKREVVKFYLYLNFFLQVLSLTWKFNGFLGSLTCVVKQKRLFSFSSLLFLETCSKH